VHTGSLYIFTKD